MHTVDLLTQQWVKAEEPTKEVESRKFVVVPATTNFGSYYDEIQGFLRTVSGMDPLLEG